MYQLTDKQKAMLDQPKALDSANPVAAQALGLSGYNQTVIFHTSMDMPTCYSWDYRPTVSERILRAQLMIEEVFETLEAMGLGLQLQGGEDVGLTGDIMHMLEITHVEGSRYDPIETADGLADIKVIANGTAVAFGIPMPEVDNEVFASNMSKLDENGRPIHNRCVVDDCLLGATYVEGSGLSDCDEPSHRIDPTKPRGKILKPANYTPANIARLYVEYTKNED